MYGIARGADSRVVRLFLLVGIPGMIYIESHRFYSPAPPWPAAVVWLLWATWIWNLIVIVRPWIGAAIRRVRPRSGAVSTEQDARGR